MRDFATLINLDSKAHSLVFHVENGVVGAGEGSSEGDVVLVSGAEGDEAGAGGGAGALLGQVADVLGGDLKAEFGDELHLKVLHARLHAGVARAGRVGTQVGLAGHVLPDALQLLLEGVVQRLWQEALSLAHVDHHRVVVVEDGGVADSEVLEGQLPGGGGVGPLPHDVLVVADVVLSRLLHLRLVEPADHELRGGVYVRERALLEREHLVRNLVLVEERLHVVLGPGLGSQTQEAGHLEGGARLALGDAEKLEVVGAGAGPGDSKANPVEDVEPSDDLVPEGGLHLVVVGRLAGVHDGGRAVPELVVVVLHPARLALLRHDHRPVLLGVQRYQLRGASGPELQVAALPSWGDHAHRVIKRFLGPRLFPHTLQRHSYAFHLNRYHFVFLRRRECHRLQQSQRS